MPRVRMTQQNLSGRGGAMPAFGGKPTPRPVLWIQKDPPQPGRVCNWSLAWSRLEPKYLSRRTRLFRDYQHLARIDFVRIFQHRLIGCENPLVRIGVAVMLLSDRGESLVTLDLMHCRLSCLGLGSAKAAVVNRFDIFDVTDNHSQLLPSCFVWHVACDFDLRAIDLNIDVAGKAEALDFFLDRFGAFLRICIGFE